MYEVPMTADKQLRVQALRHVPLDELPLDDQDDRKRYCTVYERGSLSASWLRPATNGATGRAYAAQTPSRALSSMPRPWIRRVAPRVPSPKPIGRSQVWLGSHGVRFGRCPLRAAADLPAALGGPVDSPRAVPSGRSNTTSASVYSRLPA
jgi:hypothetical protein